MGKLRPTFIVGIGGSAGALNAYKALLDALPSNTGMAFVIVSHMNPEASSYLGNILSKHTKMKVTVASDVMPIQRDHVYVSPPNADRLADADVLEEANEADAYKWGCNADEFKSVARHTRNAHKTEAVPLVQKIVNQFCQVHTNHLLWK